MERAWERGGRCLLNEISARDGGWLTAGGGRETLRTLWFGLNRAKKNVWVWIKQHFGPGLEIDAWFIRCLDIISVVVADMFHVCFFLSACLSASSLDYQQCNQVRELCGPVTAAQARFCWNPSKLTAELWKVNKTTHADHVFQTCRVQVNPYVSGGIDSKAKSNKQKCSSLTIKVQ